MRRRLLTVAIFLLAGAVVHVAVAWGCAVWVNPGTRMEKRETPEWAVATFKRPGIASSYWYPRGAATGSEDVRFYVVVSAGWPLICSSYQYPVFGVGFGPIEGGLDVGFERWRFTWSKALPVRPIWPGFAVNTFFYATLLWLLIPGPFTLRRLIRVRRGLCPKCAYPVGEAAVCSECGRELPARLAT